MPKEEGDPTSAHVSSLEFQVFTCSQRGQLFLEVLWPTQFSSKEPKRNFMVLLPDLISPRQYYKMSHKQKNNTLCLHSTFLLRALQTLFH